MKSFLIVSLSLLGPLFCLGQNHLFIENDKKWISTASEIVWYPGNPIPATELREARNHCLSTSDTTINSIVYRQLLVCESGYFGALREQDRKVFFLPGDSIREFLVYDFNLSEGDTAKQVYEMGIYISSTRIVDLVVGRVDSVQIGSEYRKRIYVGEAAVWIEGIGSSRGLFLESGANVSNYSTSLVCASTDRTQYYPLYNDDEPCADVHVGIHQQMQTEGVTIFPNPANEFFYIHQPNEKNMAVSIGDARGRIVREMILTQKTNTVDISTLQAGLYWVRCIGENQHSTSHKFTIE